MSMKRFLITVILLGFAPYSIASDVETLFNKAIAQAKQQCGIKSFSRDMNSLNDCIAKQNDPNILEKPECNLCLVNEIAHNQDVENFIKRPAEQVTFTQWYDPVIKNKYEKAMYEKLPRDTTSYRHFINENAYDRFYTSGIGNLERKLLVQEAQSAYDDTKNVCVVDMEDLYGTRDYVDAIKTQDAPTYHIGMSGKSGVGQGHAFQTVTRSVPNTKPITFVVNTGKYKDKQNAVDYYEYRFNLDAHRCKRSPFCDKSYIRERKQKRGPQWGEKLPFIMVEHDLQKNGDPSKMYDGNCGLYTYNFLKATVSYIKNGAQKFNALCDAGELEKAGNVLVEDMKHHLPMYYDCSSGHCKQKSHQDIEKYHRDLRWDVSGKICMQELKKLADAKTA